LELPAGFIENNETPEEAAKRELLEETGYTSKEMIYLGIGRLMMNRTNSVQHLFVANNIIKKSLPKDNTEIIKINQTNLFNMISNNQFVQLSGQGLILKYLIHDKLI
jgi:ADP-ribose pyrophosphatase